MADEFVLPSDAWLEIEETAYGPVVVNAYTAAEIEKMEREERRSPGICQDLAKLPPNAHIDMRALAKILRRSTKSIQRAIRREDLPKPFRFMGKCVWMAGIIVEHLQAKQKLVLETAERQAKRRERHAA
jgi:hypothetical protein